MKNKKNKVKNTALCELIMKAQGDRTQNEFANQCGVSSSALTRIFAGDYTPTAKTLKKIAHKAKNNVLYSDLLTAAGLNDDDCTISKADIEQYKQLLLKLDQIQPISTQRIPMLGSVACGKPIFADEDKESYVQAGTEIKADFCLTARGDSMIGARIHDGDIVFCRAQSSVENGEVAVVLIGDEATLKRFYFYPEKEKLVLQSENPKYAPFVYVGQELDEIKVLGKAIAFQSDVK